MRWSPPSCWSRIVQSTYASASCRIGDPAAEGRQPMRLNRSAPFVANTRQTSSWCSLRMFTVNLPAASILGHVVDTFEAQNSTSGGSSDTEVNEFAETPMGSLPSIAVMMVTPVAKCPSTVRKDGSSGGMSVSALSLSLTAGPVRSLREDGAQLED